MSRGPGHVERVIEQTMQNTDRSFTVEELALFVYPGINAAQKKHRVSVLRTFSKLTQRLPLWFFYTYKPPWRLIVTNRNNVRSYVHGLLRWSWWNAERSLAQIEQMLSDPEIQAAMEPGGIWWTDVEIHKAEAENDAEWKAAEARELVKRCDGVRSIKSENVTPAMKDLSDLLTELRSHRSYLERDPVLHVLLGKFEPPDTPAFQYAMSGIHSKFVYELRLAFLGSTSSRGGVQYFHHRQSAPARRRWLRDPSRSRLHGKGTHEW